MLCIFVLGYIFIIFEHPLQVNKSATSLLTGVLCWLVYILGANDVHLVNEELLAHLGEISSILFFLLGAMAIVEVVDAHDGFSLLTDKIKTTNKAYLLILLSVTTFFLSSLLDNLTTTIVMVSLVTKILSEKEDRLYFSGMVIIAANAGGVWSPLGDVTTTMLWIGGQISAGAIIKSLFLPGILCMAIPLAILVFKFRGQRIERSADDTEQSHQNPRRKLFLISGISALLFVPIFKMVTHLPPFMGMMFAIGIIWIIVSSVHSGERSAARKHFSASEALKKIDTPSILFFLGILLAVAALQSVHLLTDAAEWLTVHVPSIPLTTMVLGLLSSVIDNVPLVAASQGMYDLHSMPQDHSFWIFLAYATGTGGSALIIGSAAGIAAMGIEKIDFIWYLKKITFIAILGFLSGFLFLMCFL